MQVWLTRGQKVAIGAFNFVSYVTQPFLQSKIVVFLITGAALLAPFLGAISFVSGFLPVSWFAGFWAMHTTVKNLKTIGEWARRGWKAWRGAVGVISTLQDARGIVETTTFKNGAEATTAKKKGKEKVDSDESDSGEENGPRAKGTAATADADAAAVGHASDPPQQLPSNSGGWYASAFSYQMHELDSDGGDQQEHEPASIPRRIFELWVLYMFISLACLYFIKVAGSSSGLEAKRDRHCIVNFQSQTECDKWNEMSALFYAAEETYNAYDLLGGPLIPVMSWVVKPVFLSSTAFKIYPILVGLAAVLISAYYFTKMVLEPDIVIQLFYAIKRKVYIAIGWQSAKKKKLV